jgi:hypothetical protein
MTFKTESHTLKWRTIEERSEEEVEKLTHKGAFQELIFFSNIFRVNKNRDKISAASHMQREVRKAYSIFTKSQI